MHEDVWRAPASTPPSTRSSGPARATRRPSTRSETSSPTSSRATRSWSTTPSGSTSPRSATSPGGTATSCCSATPPTPRTSPSAPAPSSPWRTPSRWRPACTSTPSSRPRSRPTRRSAGPWSNPPSAPPRPRWNGSRTSAMYKDQNPVQFCFNLLTRSRRVTYDNLQAARPRVRRPGWTRNSPARRASRAARPPMFQPFRIGGLELRNRVVVSPMDMYSATDGVPGDFHLVHLGSKALGGAGLVMTEMVCVVRDGRITPGCTGLYTEAQQESLARDRRLRAQPLDGGDRRPARPLRPQGLHEAHVGGHRRAAPRGRLGAGGPLGHPVRPRQPGAARNQPRRNGPGPGRVRRRHRPCGRRRASTCWSCTARTATCSPRSSRRWPTAAPTNTADRWRTGCATRWRCSTPSARRGRPTSR